MQIDILTVFPDMVRAALDYSIVKRAMDRGLVSINVINIRDYTFDRHKTTDDAPYGGGGGMVMKVEPIALALDAIRESGEPGLRVILTEPRGTQFTQTLAKDLAGQQHLAIICGHYEGIDERVREQYVTDEISIGDFILTGGELPALLMVDAITRLQEGALGDLDGASNDTFEDGLLEYPHYTRPAEFRGARVPDILLSGHHAQIQKWRRWRQLRSTREKRPDLFAKLDLSNLDRKLIDEDEPKAPQS